MENKFPGIKERVIYLAKLKGYALESFCQSIGMSYGNFKGAAKKTPLNSNAITSILAFIPDVSIEWLLTGHGDPLRTEQARFKIDEAELLNNPIVMHVPLVGQFAYAGYLSSFSEQAQAVLPTVPIIATHQGKGKYIAIEVRGDSMDDGSNESILPHDIAICREIESIYWQHDSKIHYKKWAAFLIVHKIEGILIKKIIGHDTAKKQITIRALNSEYPDQILDLKDIHKLFTVIQIIRNK